MTRCEDKPFLIGMQREKDYYLIQIESVDVQGLAGLVWNR